MKIGIIGYGKMGKTIEKAALYHGHVIMFKINSKNKHELNPKTLSKIDIAIEFSTPSSAFENISFCLMNNTPVVSGTTGWLEKLDEIRILCKKQKGAFLYAENFSIGMNIFFQLNSYLAQLMAKKDYQTCIEETHHTSKKDTPSGTAIKIQIDLNKSLQKHDTIPIKSNRIGNIKGEHEIKYFSKSDSINIKHTANNREGFAKGVILATEFLKNKTGVFSMRDVIKN